MFDLLKKKLKDSVAKITKAVVGEESKEEPKEEQKPEVLEESKQEIPEPITEPQISISEPEPIQETPEQGEKQLTPEQELEELEKMDDTLGAEADDQKEEMEKATEEPDYIRRVDTAPAIEPLNPIEGAKHKSRVAASTSEDEDIEELKQDVTSKFAELETVIEKAESDIREVQEEAHKPIVEELKPIEEPKIEKPKKKGGLLKRIFSNEVELTEEQISPILNDLTLDLSEGDVAFEVGEKIAQDLRKSLIGASVSKKKIEEFVMESMQNSLENIFASAPEIDLLSEIKKAKNEKRPYLIVFIGFNGAGKTTSLAKFAQYLKNQGYSSVLAAGDTFRAASIEQLEEHASRLGANVIKHKYGSDSAAVIFDAVEHARARKIDVVLADTAGRSHANSNLMDELKKVFRVNKADLKLLVIDSLTGNDAVEQATNFDKAVAVDAIVLTKIDVNPKGGAALSVVHAIKKPILFMGTGQAYENIKLFNPREFIETLLK